MANRQNTLLLKRSNVIGKLPLLSGLTLGEMALNTADAKLYSLFTSGSVSPTEVRQIGWDRISRTGDTVTGDFNFFGDIKISGSSQPNGYVLSVSGDTNLNGNTTIQSGLTANTIYTNYIDFNTTYVPTVQEGRLHWDQDYGTLDVDLEGNNISLKVGLDNLYYIKNQSGSTIDKGRVVRSAGTVGNSGRILGEYMIADGTIPYYFTLGIAGEDILDGEDGYVYEFGLVRGVNTTGSLYGETWVDGTVLYVSPTIPGGLTSVEPTEPNLKIQMAIVIDAAVNGSLFVRPSLGSNLGDLHNVQTSGQTNGDLISYNSSQGYWEYTKTLNGNYTISGNTSHIGNFNITGNTNQSGNFNITGNTIQSGNTDQIGNFNMTGNTNQLGDTNQIGTFNLTGNTNQIGNFTITGNTTQSGNTIQYGNVDLTGNTSQLGNSTQTGNVTLSGDTFITGNTTQSGTTNQLGDFNITGDTDIVGDLFVDGNIDYDGNLDITGNFNITGNTNQLGYNYIVSATTGCTFAVTGNTCLDGDLEISGNTFMSGDFCMNNMNSTGQTGTNCFDTSLIPTGTTVINEFQLKSGVLAHLGDLSTGEPNSRGFTFFENNIGLTSFVAVGTGVYTPVIGAPQTLPAFNNLFIVTTGATTATTNKLTYDYPPATGSTFAFLKFTSSLSIEVAQNQELTFQIQRTRGLSVTNIPIGMGIKPTGNGANAVSFNGIAEAQNQDEFVLVVRNASGSGGSNSIRITDLSFSMFT